MRRAAALFILLFAGLYSSAAQANAELCLNTPGAGAPPRTWQQIEEEARIGFTLLKNESGVSGSQRTGIAEARASTFDRVALWHWRWTCARRAKLSTLPREFSDVLVRGVIYFDLAEDVPNMGRWYRIARPQVQEVLASGLEMPEFRRQPLDRLLRRAQPRLTSRSPKQSGWILIEVQG